MAAMGMEARTTPTIRCCSITGTATYIRSWPKVKLNLVETPTPPFMAV